MGRLFAGADRDVSSPAPPLPSSDVFTPGGERTAFRITRTASGTDQLGTRVFRSGVGISYGSEAEAEQVAAEQARAAVDAAISAGGEARRGYAYHADKRLEPLVDVLRGPAGELARVTVNSYGALVLNAASALFVDVDGPDQATDDDAQPAELGEVLQRRPELAFRTYRTRAGWRFLCTSTLFDPTSMEAHDLLTELRADEKYVLLCSLQKSFRARLTPKPWRAGYRAYPVPLTRGLERRAVQRYVDKTWRYATTRFAGGPAVEAAIAEIRPVVDHHDHWTQANSGKPLA